jgi:hypothetical protein
MEITDLFERYADVLMEFGLYHRDTLPFWGKLGVGADEESADHAAG